MKTKNILKRSVKAMLIFTLLLSFVSCGDAAIDLVKEDTFANYQDAPVETILDAMCDDGDWSVATNDVGKKTVTFTGVISEAMHAKACVHLDKSRKTLWRLNAIKREIAIQRRDKLGDMPIGPEKSAADKEIRESVMNDYYDNFCKVGDAVELTWIVSPDGEHASHSTYSCDSFGKTKFSWIIAIAVQ